VKIKIIREWRGREIEVGEKKTVMEVIAGQGLNDETFVTVLNDRIAHPSERLRDGDVLEFVEVIYGG